MDKITGYGFFPTETKWFIHIYYGDDKKVIELDDTDSKEFNMNTIAWDKPKMDFYITKYLSENQVGSGFDEQLSIWGGNKLQCKNGLLYS